MIAKSQIVKKWSSAVFLKILCAFLNVVCSAMAWGFVILYFTAFEKKDSKFWLTVIFILALIVLVTAKDFKSGAVNLILFPLLLFSGNL